MNKLHPGLFVTVYMSHGSTQEGGSRVFFLCVCVSETGCRAALHSAAVSAINNGLVSGRVGPWLPGRACVLFIFLMMD